MTVTADATAATDLLARATALVPDLRARASEGDKARQYPADLVQTLRDQGLLSLWVPREYGGAQMDMTGYIDITSELARGDATAGWLSMIINGSGKALAGLPKEAKDEVWRDEPGTGFCGTLTPSGEAKKVDGGWVINGSFGWASGSHHAAWGIIATMLTKPDGSVMPGNVLLSADQWTVKETWFTMGMRGTGSNTLIVTDAFVPDHRAMEILDFLTPGTEMPYSLPTGPFMSLWATPVPLGLAKAALELVQEQLPKRSIAYTSYMHQVDAVSTQLELANAAIKIEAADALLHKAAATVDAAGRAGGQIDEATSALIKLQGCHAVRLCREAVNEILELAGASVAADSNPLQQVFRDINTAANHGLLRHAVAAEAYGRILVGKDAGITMV